VPNSGGRRRIGEVSTGSLTEASSMCSKSSAEVEFREPKSALNVFGTLSVVTRCGGLRLCDDDVLTFPASRKVFGMFSATISRFAITGRWLQQLQFPISCSSMPTSVSFSGAIVVPFGGVCDFRRFNLGPGGK
jgi:hypothetical protein